MTSTAKIGMSPTRERMRMGNFSPVFSISQS